MVHIGKFFIIILFVVSVFVSLIIYTIKFEILDYTFWQKTLSANSVYSRLTTVLQDNLKNQVVKSGGSKNEAKVFTDLITSANLQNTVENNLRNILNFTNGKVGEIEVYLPVDKIPKGFMPTSLTTISQETPLNAFLKEFNISGIDERFLKNLSQLGLSTTYLFVISVSVSFLLLLSLFLMTTSGAHFISPGIGLVISGACFISIALLTSRIESASNSGLVAGGSLVNEVIAITGPAVLSMLFKPWFFVGIIFLILGTISIIIKRPSATPRD